MLSKIKLLNELESDRCRQTIKPLNELESDKEHIKVKCWPCSCGKIMHTTRTAQKKDASGSTVEESWVENFKLDLGFFCA